LVGVRKKDKVGSIENSQCCISFLPLGSLGLYCTVCTIYESVAIILIIIMEQYILLENIIFESLSSSSSDSDDNNEELQNILFENRGNNNRGERKIVPKITHYLENVVTRYTNIEFKSHFR